MDMIYESIPVVIPALNPDNRIIKYIRSLEERGFNRFVVVDDGSLGDALPIFKNLEYMRVNVVRLDHNMGKGYALKEGLKYIRNNMPDASGVIMTDYDGRQGPDAVVKVADRLLKGDMLVLGRRDIENSNISKAMRRGYKLTERVFRILYSRSVKDVQTGLRGISASLIDDMIDVRGSRYEYEPKMIVEALSRDIPVTEIDAGPIEPIDTDDSIIYVSKNFRPLYDSFRISVVIFMTFLEYALTSISATIVDFILFFLLSEYVFNAFDLNICVLLSTVCARIVSSTISFSINRKVVFKSEVNLAKNIIMFYSLAALIMLCSAELVTIFVYLFNGNKTFTKLFVDLCLFFVSYQVQQRVIFKKK